MELNFKKLIALAVFPAFLLAGCQENEDEEMALLDAEYEELEDKIDEQQAIQSKLTKEKNDLTKTIRDFQYNQKKEAAMLLEIQPIVDYMAKLDESDKYLDSELDLWRPATRDSFKGVELGNLDVAGKSYPNAVISSVTDDGLIIDSNGAEATILFEELPIELRLKLVHEPTVKAGEVLK